MPAVFSKIFFQVQVKCFFNIQARMQAIVKYAINYLSFKNLH